MDIGKIIRDLRKLEGFSQKELAKDICTQAQISKLENGTEIPSSETLYLLSQRLGVDMNYFFDIKETPRLDYVIEVENQIRHYIRERNYQTVYELVLSEKNNPLFKNSKNQQFLIWHEGICEYYLNRDKQKAISLLYHSIDQTRYGSLLKEREIEIMNSIAIIHYEEREREKSIEIFKILLDHLKFLPQLSNSNIKIRIYYGLAKALTDLKKYEESLKITEKGINLCVKNETLYLLGELNYQKGDNLLNLKRTVEGIEYLDNAISVFKLINNNSFIKLVEKEKNRLLSKL